MKLINRKIFITLSCMLLAAGPLFGAKRNKAFNTDNLDQATSWTSSVPTTADSGRWRATEFPASGNTVSLGSDQDWGGLMIGAPGGAITINAGNTLTIREGISMDNDSPLFTINCNLNLNGGLRTFDADGGGLIITGVVSNGSFVKTGSSALTLSNNSNSFDGPIYVSGGDLSISSILNVGGGASAAGAPTSAANGTIYLGNQSTANSELLYAGTGNTTGRVINLYGTTGSVTIRQSGTGLIKFTSDIAISYDGAKTLIIRGTSDGTGEIAGAIPNSGNGATSVTKSGTGKWTLSGTNTYTGVTTLNAGTLSVATIGNGGVAGNLGQATNDAANLVFNGAELEYTGATASTDRNFTIMDATTIKINVTTNNLTISGASTATTGALTKTGNGTLTLAGNNSYTGTTLISAGTLSIGAGSTTGAISNSSNITDNATLQFYRSDAITYSGAISGTGAVVQAGSGSTTLSNTNSYTGATTVNAGTLLVIGSTDGGSAVGVTGTIGGTGTVGGSITLNNGSTLAPGTGGNTIGTLRTANITFNATSTYTVDLDGVGQTKDSIYSTGTVALGAGTNAVLTVASIANSVNGKVYNIIGAALVTGMFSGKADNSTFVVSGRTLRINYTGTKVTLTDLTSGPVQTWARTGLGTINGGSIGETKIFLGTTTPNAIIGRNLTDGSSAWSYTTGITSGCGTPTYSYISGAYVLVAASGNNVVGVNDDGTTHFAATDIGGAAGTPYISPDNTNFFVTRPGYLSKRLLSDGSQVAGWDVAVPNISTLADPVVYSDYIYVATTNGKVHMGDAGDFTPLTTYEPATLSGVSIILPLMVSGNTLYITPNNNTLHAVTTSALTTTKTLVTYSNGSANSGPAWSEIDATNDTVYTAADVYVYLIKDVAGGERWCYTAAAAVNSGPLVCNNTVYFGANGGRYYAINKADKSDRSGWPYTSASGNATSGPWIDVFNSRVIFGTTGGNLDAFALEP